MKRKSSAAALVALAVVALILRFAPAAVASNTENVLYTFTGQGDGNLPLGALTRDSSGNLYGTAAFGGTNNNGVVFELTPNPSGGWTYNVIYRFSGNADGAVPVAGVVLDSQGNLFGTCDSGGTGYGTVFELSLSGGSWTLTKYYDFTGAGDGAEPDGNVVLDSAGSLYSTTYRGAAGYGTVFKMTPSGNSWTEQTLHTFTGGNDGGNPLAGLIMDRYGNLYGTTVYGGSYNAGTVFKLHNTGNNWIETVLYAFTADPNGSDGAGPQGAPTLDSAGNVYGTTFTNLNSGSNWGFGGIYKLSPWPTTRQATSASGQWQITWLHHFTGGDDGGWPYAGVTFDRVGNLYGTTGVAGAYARGVVFKLTPSPWSESVLWNFTGGNDGSNPESGIILDNSGDLYGTTVGGGSGAGVIFEVTQ